MSTVPTLTDALQAALAGLAPLGASREDVAERLEVEGCRGVPGRPCDCPVARYLAAKLQPDFPDVHPAVSSMQVEARTEKGFGPGSAVLASHHIRNPAVSDFISAFDRGLFPELEDKS